MMKKIYFGHPINVYGTELEELLLALIAAHCQELSQGLGGVWIVDNPGDKHHQDECLAWKIRTGNAMDYFYSSVLPQCSAGIFLPFTDGQYGAGVHGEARWLMERGWPIWGISYKGKIKKIYQLREMPALSVDETRKRIRDAQGGLLPY